MPACGQLIMNGSLNKGSNSSIQISAMAGATFYCNLSTNSGPIGTILTLTGADFSSASTLIIGSTAGLILSYSSTSLVALVMPQNISGLVIVMNPNTSTISATQLFTITPTGVPAKQQAKLIGTGVLGGFIY